MMKLGVGAVTLVLGSSLVASSYLVADLNPHHHTDEVSQIAHLDRPPNPADYGTIVATHEVEIANERGVAQQNQSDIRSINASIIELDKRELEHYNALARKQEVDETQVVATLKVIGWLVSLAEGVHLSLTVRTMFFRKSKRRRGDDED